MSKRKRKQVDLFIGLKNATNTIAGTSQTDRHYKWNRSRFYTGPVASFMLPFTEHKASFTSHINHSTPRPYVMYGCKSEYNNFDMEWERSPTTFYHAYGKTGSGSGDLSVPNLSKWGLKQAGSYWVPAVSDSLVTRAITEAKVKLSNRDLNLVTSIAEAASTIKTMSSLLTSIAGVISRLVKNGDTTVKVGRDVFYTEFNGELVKSSYDNYVLAMKRNRTANAAVNRTYNKYAANVANSREGPYGPLQAPMWVPKSKRPRSRQGTKRTKVYESKTVRSPIFVRGNGSLMSGAENAWLNAMYGIIPIWFDFIGLSAAAARALQKPGAQVKALRTIENKGAIPSDSSSFSYKGSWKYGVECQLNYRMDDPHLNTLAALGFTNPFALWWELTPYSFVFDWLIPVGNMLEALTADAGLIFESGFTNTKSFCDITVTGVLPNREGTLPSGRFRNVSQLRSVMVSAPITGLYMKSPFSAIHAVSAIALVGQQLRRK